MASVRELRTKKQIADAVALESSVFGGRDDVRKIDRYYGVYDKGRLVALTRVNTDPLAKWKKDTAYKKLKKLNPDIWISATAVDPAHRRKGYATLLKKHLQKKYDRILTGTDTRQSHKAMPGIQRSLGYRPISQRGTSTQWYWEKKSAAIGAKIVTNPLKESQNNIRNFMKKQFPKSLSPAKIQTDGVAKAVGTLGVPK